MRGWPGCRLLGFLVLVGARPAPVVAQDKVDQTIIALEREWSDAEAANDANRLAPLLADRFVNTYDGEVSGKAEMVSAASTARWTSSAYDSLEVSVFGNTAIVIGILRRKGIDQTGRPFAVNERFTDTWVRMPTGHWQCVASHGSTIRS